MHITIDIMHITIDGFEACDGALSPAWKADNERHFAFLRAQMRKGLTEKEGDALYGQTFTAEQRGQANCRTCGLWNCTDPHEED